MEVGQVAEDIPETDAVAELDGAGRAHGHFALADVGVIAETVDEGFPVAVNDAVDIGHREGGGVVGQDKFHRASDGVDGGGDD